MILVYSEHRVSLAEGQAYRNPRLFHAIDPVAISVVVVGHHPKIAAAYRAAGIEVAEPAPDDAWGKMPVLGTFLCGSEDEIPVIREGWRDLAWPELRALGQQCSNSPVLNKVQAVAAIESYQFNLSPMVPSP